jgi:hypothetical protein
MGALVRVAGLLQHLAASGGEAGADFVLCCRYGKLLLLRSDNGSTGVVPAVFFERSSSEIFFEQEAECP